MPYSDPIKRREMDKIYHARYAAKHMKVCADGCGRLITREADYCPSCKNRHGRPLHFMTHTPIHRAWVAMIQRCENPNSRRYKDWGGRGITVCERWKKFAKFYADMGDRPPGLSLDRIDNDGNYEPGNCRWATRSEQQRNKRPFKWHRNRTAA